MPDRIEVLSWDYKEQPDLETLARIVRDMSGGTVYLHDVGDTGGQDYALVVADRRLTSDEVAEVWRRRWSGEEA
jgi:hypothetical protein